MATTIPDGFTDLLEAPIAILATNGPDGRPQVSAVWFLAEGGTIQISLNVERQKTKNLRADPAVTFFVLDPGGYRYLEVRGDAAIQPDADYTFADEVGAKYGGADLREMDGPDGQRVVVTVQPTRVNAVDMSGAG